ALYECFFFQAEDGIRDFHVTGVQTCALPIWTPHEVQDILGTKKGEFFCRIYDITEQGNFEGKNIPNLIGQHLDGTLLSDNRALRSEERRVGKECRYRWSP